MANHERPEGQQQRTGPEPIASEKVENQNERKTFFLDLIENRRGRALRFKERANGKTDMVIIPVASLREIGDILLRMADWSEKNP